MTIKEKASKVFFSIRHSKLTLIPVALLIALLLFYFKGLFVAASVNGVPITRLEVLKQLEKEGGKSVLDSIITNKLILQEAKKEKITVTENEIASQISQIETNLKAQGQDLNSALSAQGMTRSDLDDQIKLQILVQKMAGKNISITDEDISNYFKENESMYPKGTTLESVKDEIRNTLTQQKLSSSVGTWISDLKAKAKILRFVSY